MTIENLEAYGANTKEGLQRCLNNESFYIRMVKMIPGDANFQKLYAAIDAGDLETAFDAAHALKGSVGNLALTPISEPIFELTELLRSKTEADYKTLVEQVRKGRDELERLCAE